MRILIFMALLGLYSIAHAQDYREEITEHVIKPCVVEAMDVDEMSFKWGLSVDETCSHSCCFKSKKIWTQVYEAVLPASGGP